jgi:hypothetical protein
MTQQTVLLRQLWHDQPPNGYRFRATIQADPYSRDEGRSFWVLSNPTLLKNRTVLASHMWATQDQTLPYAPPIGATISFDAQVSPYMRRNGIPGFGLINLHNVAIEPAAGVDALAADYDTGEDDTTADEFALAVTEPLTELDLDDIASGRMEQNIVVGAQRRSEKLSQRIQFNARLATLARLQEEVTAEFLTLGQRALTIVADLAQLDAEIAADPDMEEERRDLQQLATRQRDLAAASWRWQPSTVAESGASANANSSQIAPTSPLTVSEPPSATTPSAAPISEPPPPEEEAPQFDILGAIKAELAARHPAAPPIRITPPRQKASKRPPAPQTQREAMPLADAPPAVSSVAPLLPVPPIEGVADEWQHEDAAFVAELAEATAEEANAAEPDAAMPAPTSERTRDNLARPLQIVEQVWYLVQHKQPRQGHHAAYTLAQIKDGRRRETDHLKLIGLKAILELLTLLGERPTRKELGNRYLGYDLPKAWALSKLSQEKLPLEDEQVRAEIVSEIKATLLATV